MNYYRPSELSDALAWLSHNQGTVVAGCTDLFPSTDKPLLQGQHLDITALRALRGVEETAGYWRFGGATAWSDIVRHPMPASFDGLRCAARQIGSVQIQNSATLGGNLCNASPAADGVPPLLTLDAEVELASVAGTRTLPLAAFLLGPRKTARQPDELLTAVLVPKASARGASVFNKLGARKYLVISIAMVAARLEISGSTVRKAAIAVGACSAVATRLPVLEAALCGQPAGADIGQLVTADLIDPRLSPISDVRAEADYRRRVVVELVRRCVTGLAAQKPDIAA